MRHSLQQEFLRLQQDIGKTIVLVTHDIDEAVKLGDQVAVFAEGGRLAQVAAPEELLASPADDFVRSLVGRDRGFRGLSFESAADLEVEPVETEVDGLTLELDGDRRPRGWKSPDGTLADRGHLDDLRQPAHRRRPGDPLAGRGRRTGRRRGPRRRAGPARHAGRAHPPGQAEPGRRAGA